MARRTSNNGADGSETVGAEANLKEAPPVQGALGQGQRWTLTRKRDVVLRLLRGESVVLLSRELGIEIHRLEEWRERALSGLEVGLRERAGDPRERELEMAKRRIGELSMENELLRERCRRNGPFGLRTSK